MQMKQSLQKNSDFSMLENAGYEVVETMILPDEKRMVWMCRCTQIRSLTIFRWNRSGWGLRIRWMSHLMRILLTHTRQ